MAEQRRCECIGGTFGGIGTAVSGGGSAILLRSKSVASLHPFSTLLRQSEFMPADPYRPPSCGNIPTLLFGLIGLLLAGAAPAQPDQRPATIAIASSLLPWAQEQQRRFAETHGVPIVLASGSTGKHYAQIIHGAPFDAWLAADSVRPAELHADGFGVAPPRTFAYGSLVLWQPSAEPNSLDWLTRPASGGRLSIANPALAPYGLAAEQALRTMNLWSAWQARLVRGDNVAQAMHFVASGHADAGLIALSLLIRPGHALPTTATRIPPEWHAPIRHDALHLRRHPGAAAFLDFLMKPAAQASLAEFGLQPANTVTHHE